MNKVLLVGRLAKDPKLFTTPSGIPYARTTLAINDKNSRDNSKTDFVPILAWEKTASFIAEHLPKGALVSIEGKLTSGSFERNGSIVRTIDVVVSSIQSLESLGVIKQRQQENTSSVSLNNKISTKIETPYEIGEKVEIDD